MTKRRYAWLTPDTPAPEETLGRCFTVPNDGTLVAAVTGALLPLTYEKNWQQMGSMTSSEAAAIMSDAFEAFVVGNCGGEGCPPDFGFGTDYPPLRRTTTGQTEVWDGDSWETPIGDYAIPAPAARGESTEAEQNCGAASNAANVLHDLFDSFQSVWNTEVDPRIEQAAWATDLAVAIGSVFGPISETFLVLNSYFWGAMGAISDEIGAAGWPDEWTDKLVCILQSHVETNASGVVSFGFQEVCWDLTGFILPVLDEFIEVRWFTWYLLNIIGAEGLNRAGGTTDVEGDCASCDTWYRVFDFRYGSKGWTYSDAGDRAVYENSSDGGRWKSTYTGGGTGLILRVGGLPTTGWSITRLKVETFFNNSGGSPVLQVANTSVTSIPDSVTGSWQTYDTGFTLNTGAGYRLAFYNFLGGNYPCYFRRLWVWGTGTMPFNAYQGAVGEGY